MREYIGWVDDEWNTVLDPDQPIVRCRDCKHFYVSPFGAARYCEKIEALWLDARDDGFCAWGERRSDG